MAMARGANRKPDLLAMAMMRGGVDVEHRPPHPEGAFQGGSGFGQGCAWTVLVRVLSTGAWPGPCDCGLPTTRGRGR